LVFIYLFLKCNAEVLHKPFSHAQNFTIGSPLYDAYFHKVVWQNKAIQWRKSEIGFYMGEKISCGIFGVNTYDFSRSQPSILFLFIIIYQFSQNTSI